MSILSRSVPILSGKAFGTRDDKRDMKEKISANQRLKNKNICEFAKLLRKSICDIAETNDRKYVTI